MTPNPVVCRRSDSANHAARLMWEHDVGSLPVVDDDGRLCGMVTDRDLCMGAYTQGQPLAAINVATTMARHVVKAEVHDEAKRVLELMARHRVRRIPVVDEHDRPIGIVAIHDLARRSDTGQPAVVSEHDLAATLRAICTPHNLPAKASSRSVAVAS
jgi:CBS domain-containing protein